MAMKGDGELASKIGLALVKTHDYTQAIRYYESALKTDVRQAQLRADLAAKDSEVRELRAKVASLPV